VKRASGTPCAAAVTHRTLEVDLRLNRQGARKSASLAQGRLLVGVVGGDLQVYYLMH
jgi:hypothetical protein